MAAIEATRLIPSVSPLSHIFGYYFTLEVPSHNFNSYTLLYSSELVTGTLNPEWRPLQISGLLPLSSLHSASVIRVTIHCVTSSIACQFQRFVPSEEGKEKGSCQTCSTDYLLHLAKRPTPGPRWSNNVSSLRSIFHITPKSLHLRHENGSGRVFESSNNCAIQIKEEDILTATVQLGCLQPNVSKGIIFLANVLLLDLQDATYCVPLERHRFGHSVSTVSFKNVMIAVADGEDIEERMGRQGNTEKQPIVVTWTKLEESMAKLSSSHSFLQDKLGLRDTLGAQLHAKLKEREQRQQNEEQLELLQQRVNSYQRMLATAKEDATREKEQLNNAVDNLQFQLKDLLTSSRALTAARTRLKEAEILLSQKAGERANVLFQALSWRRRRMICQVAAIYPLLIQQQSTSGYLDKSDSSIADLQGRESAVRHVVAEKVGKGINALVEPKFTVCGLRIPDVKKLSQETTGNKAEQERFSAAFGYIAHTILLIASYLDVRLPYLVHQMGSTSRICDHPSLLSVTVDTLPARGAPAGGPLTGSGEEYPLYFEGQDSIAVPKAIALLNKNIAELFQAVGLALVEPGETTRNLHYLLMAVRTGSCHLASWHGSPDKLFNGKKLENREAYEPTLQQMSQP